MEKKEKKLRHVRRHLIIVEEDTIMNTIVNTPMDPRTKSPMFKRMDVQQRKLVRAGQHVLWRAILADRRGRYHLREVIV